MPSSSPGLWGQLISDEIPKSTAPTLLPEVTLTLNKDTPYSFGIFPHPNILLLKGTTAVQQHPKTVADTQQPTPHGNPRQQKHLGQQSRTLWEAALAFPPPSMKHFTSAIYLKVSST